MKIAIILLAALVLAISNAVHVCVDDHTDYWGADIRSFKVHDFNHCAHECHKADAQGCRSFTFRKRDNHCWLKYQPFGAGFKKNNELTSANMDCDSYSTLPSWPQDFRWNSAGTPRGYTCDKIWEMKDPNTWNDNYMCWRNDRADPGLRWSMAGAIPGQRCTQIHEGAEPAGHTWKDNFLCVQNNSPYHFSWTSSNQGRDNLQHKGQKCIQWVETADPHTWKDNWLCNAPYHGHHVTAPLPQWPDDFKWSNAGVPKGYHCDRIWELAEPANHHWNDNFFCWRENKADPGIRFNMNGAVTNSYCVQIKEGADPNTWNDNFLCVPPTSPYAFTWVFSGALKDQQYKAGKTCIQWTEPADPHTWNDNYLCHYPLQHPDARHHRSQQRRVNPHLRTARIQVTKYKTLIASSQKLVVSSRKVYITYHTQYLTARKNYLEAHKQVTVYTPQLNAAKAASNTAAKQANNNRVVYKRTVQKINAARVACINKQKAALTRAEKSNTLRHNKLDAQYKKKRQAVYKIQKSYQNAVAAQNSHLAKSNTAAAKAKVAAAAANKAVADHNSYVKSYNAEVAKVKQYSG